MYGYKPTQEQHIEDEVDSGSFSRFHNSHFTELLYKCIDQLHSAINTSPYTEEELVEAVRKANYSVSMAMKYLPSRSRGMLFLGHPFVFIAC